MKQRFAAITLIAMVAHNVNKAYCDAIGDPTQKSWEEAEDWQKDSARAGVEAHLKNPGMTPEERHNAWSDYKLADGWKYGEVKDAEKKTHPCLIPFGMLPKEQQVKDHLFGAVVSSMAPDLAAALNEPTELESVPDGEKSEAPAEPVPAEPVPAEPVPEAPEAPAAPEALAE